MIDTQRAGGGLYPLCSKEATDNRIMVVDYTVDGASLVPGKARVWSDRQLFTRESPIWI